MEGNNKKKNNYYKNNNHGKNYYQHYYRRKKKQLTPVEEVKEDSNILLSNEEQIVEPINNVNEEIGTPRQVVQEILKTNNDYEEMEFVPIKKTETIKYKRKSKFLYALGAFIIVAIVFGVSYSFFTYTKVDPRQADIASGEVYVRIADESVNLTLNKMYPRTNEEARAREDNYLDFTLQAKNTSETKEVKYTLNITNGENVQGKTRIDPQYLIMDLQEKVGNEYRYIKEAEPLSTFSFEGIVPVNTTSEIEKEYRLRIWVSDAITISDTEANASYTQAEFSNLYANIHIEVNSVDQTHVPSFAETLSEKASTVSYIASYDDIIEANPTFTTQDQVSTSSTKQTVYYFTGDDAAANANVLFAGYCWQIIRTTDNGGVRMIYNGVAVNNKCETTRTATKGINGTNGTSTSLSGASLFGRSYDYNLNTGEFTLQDSTGLPTAWNDTNYKDLIGTYTCNSSSSTCTTLYYVGSYESNTNAYTASYTIGDVAHFSQIGTSAFNSNYRSPALVGYMFNTEYDYKSGSKSGEYFTTAVWENGAYTLSNGNGGTEPDATHHYICDSDCTKVRYYYYVSGSSYRYILLENGMTIEDALYKMTGYGNATTLSKPINANYELNNYNSAMKGYLDNWYKKNLTGYTSYLDESSVYCNDRSIRDLGGWNPSGTSLTGSLQFKQYSINRDLNCVNETDRFAVTNNKAKLTYPIGLLTEPERILITSNFAKTGQTYRGASPNGFNDSYALVRGVSATGGYSYNTVHGSNGARGVVSLRPGTKLENGSGTYTDPYVVGPLVTRTN